MRELERRVLLSVLDRKWREHLYEMDYLREGIYLRAYSQRDPLVEYQREGFDMFAAMMDGIKEEAVGFLFNLEVTVEDDGRPSSSREDERRRGRRRRGRASRAARGARRSAPRAWSVPTTPPQKLAYSAPDEDGEVEVRAATPSPPPTTSSPTSAATPSAPAARARSTSSATARRADPTGLTTRVNG